MPTSVKQKHSRAETLGPSALYAPGFPVDLRAHCSRMRALRLALPPGGERAAPASPKETAGYERGSMQSMDLGSCNEPGIEFEAPDPRPLEGSLQDAFWVRPGRLEEVKPQLHRQKRQRANEPGVRQRTWRRQQWRKAGLRTADARRSPTRGLGIAPRAPMQQKSTTKEMKATRARGGGPGEALV